MANLPVPYRGKPMMLVDRDGNPFSRTTAHEAAGRTTELLTWNAKYYSPDSALLPELDTLRNRTADVIRNNGLMSGAVQTHLDNVIGTGLRLNAKPDWRLVGPGVSESARADWESAVEAKFVEWADDPINCYCDAARRSTFDGIMSQAYRSYLTAFEVLGTGEWITDNPLSKYSTAVQLLAPSRLSTPTWLQDNDQLRAGVALTSMGAPNGYWISTEANDQFGFQKIKSWKFYRRETEWGRKLVLHHYDNDEPGQTRGKNGIVSVLAKLRMLEKFEQAHLQAAILNAMYAAVIESPLDWESVGTALGMVDTNPVLQYVKDMMTWQDNSKGIRYNGLAIPHLYPGEKLNLMAPQHPNAAFNSFEESVMRYLASGLNLSYEQLSRDYSKTNYSSSRAAMLEGWKFFNGKMAYVAAPLATNIYALWLEEAFDLGEVEYPAGTALEFLDSKTAWTKCSWIGPARGNVDPEKDANAARAEYALHLTTLEELCAARGKDWRAVLRQRAQEKAFMGELGLDPPDLAAAAVNAPPPSAQPAQPEPPPGTPERRNVNG